MKQVKFYIIPLLGSMFFSCKPPAYSPVTTGPSKQKEGLHLVWAEEFSGKNKPDSDSWSYEHGFIRNEELQWYQRENARLENGLLIIEGRKEEIKNDTYDPNSDDWRKNRKVAYYTSSSINTRGKEEFQYGVIEVRARIDTARGTWPAIWTLGVEKPWPSNGEIDILELYRLDKRPHILANAAWKGAQENVKWDSEKIPFTSFMKKDQDWVQKFHIWKMDWTKEYIKLYLDDQLINEIDLSRTKNPDGFNPFHQPHYILLNLALGSNGGDPAKTEFPQQYEVDYVRVYQKIE
jgi:beta-glucanase (GH16 family)